MKPVLSLLALIELSTSSRMLLQYRPQFPAVPRPVGWAPGGTTQIYTPPAQPNNPFPTVPAPPAGNGRPAPPNNVPAPAPAVVQPNPQPWFTTLPPTLPQIAIPAGMGIHMCEEGPLTPGAPPPCSMVEMTVTNPIDGFSFECATTNACAGSTVNINLDLMTSNVASFKGISCADTGACDGASFIVNNGQEGGHSLEIDHLECNGGGSCTNIDIVLGYETWLMGVMCSSIEDCGNCNVRTMDPLVPPTSCYVMATQGGKYPA